MQKKHSLFLLTSLIIIVSFIGISFSFSKSASAITNKAGDIIITNSTAPGLSGKGIVGHTGIFIDKNTILHTSGRKNEPYPKKISLKNWNKRYPKTKVVRPNSATLGKKASQQAIKYFYKKSIPYKISPNVTNIKTTYCSELVWYSYYKAGKSFNSSTTIVKEFYTKKYWHNPTIIKPYDFLIKSYVDHNGFKIIDNKW